MSDQRPIRRMPLEVAVFSVESAVDAQRAGASRVELNAPGSYLVGGLTPPVEELIRLRAQVDLPVHIMIRPRGAPANGRPDFVYSAAELAQMMISICHFKSSSLMNPTRGDRFVVGAVREIVDEEYGPTVTIDETVCRALVEIARPFRCIFHRAFDPIAATRRGPEGAERLARLGFEGVLTAGGVKSSCCDLINVDRIDNICHRMAGRFRIAIGGGLRSHNVGPAAAQLSRYDDGTIWFHTSAVKVRDGVPTEILDIDELYQLLGKLALTEPT